jgi:hypothetical protein
MIVASGITPNAQQNAHQQALDLIAFTASTKTSSLLTASRDITLSAMILAEHY